MSQPILEMTVSKMQPSKEFKEFGRMFIQDFHLFGSTLEEVIDYIVREYDHHKRSKLRNFIDELLESNINHQEMQKLWSATDSDIYFTTAEGFRDFLRTTRDRL